MRYRQLALTSVVIIAGPPLRGYHHCCKESKGVKLSIAKHLYNLFT